MSLVENFIGKGIMIGGENNFLVTRRSPARNLFIVFSFDSCFGGNFVKRSIFLGQITFNKFCKRKESSEEVLSLNYIVN